MVRPSTNPRIRLEAKASQSASAASSRAKSQTPSRRLHAGASHSESGGKAKAHRSPSPHRPWYSSTTANGCRKHTDSHADRKRIAEGRRAPTHVKSARSSNLLRHILVVSPGTRGYSTLGPLTLNTCRHVAQRERLLDPARIPTSTTCFCPS